MVLWCLFVCSCCVFLGMVIFCWSSLNSGVLLLMLICCICCCVVLRSRSI